MLPASSPQPMADWCHGGPALGAIHTLDHPMEPASQTSLRSFLTCPTSLLHSSVPKALLQTPTFTRIPTPDFASRNPILRNQVTQVRLSIGSLSLLPCETLRAAITFLFPKRKLPVMKELAWDLKWVNFTYRTVKSMEGRTSFQFLSNRMTVTSHKQLLSTWNVASMTK